MSKTTIKLLIDQNNNSLTFSRNFRIFSTEDPINGLIEFTDFIEDIIVNDTSPGSDLTNLSNIQRYFRYSRNKFDWSLWYSISPFDLGEAGGLLLDANDSFYFEIKYLYDDGTDEQLLESVSINEIKLRFTNGLLDEDKPLTYSPVVISSDEKNSSIVVNRDPSFRPYEVNSAIGLYNEMSFFTNILYGHQVIYFRTLPEANSGDYIFKEWTLYKNVDRQCIKVSVPKNAFPSNKPKYEDTGFNFELPFEIHIDHRYFQSIFGCDSEPRKRDFLYFPIVNRMYEIQGSYLSRGFMMSPTFWKIQLKKFDPNIDMLLTDETRHFLDNVIVSADKLFSKKVEDDISDGTMKKQYNTISTTFDSSRRSIHPELTLKPLKYTFNFASLIENYYDLGSIPINTNAYIITNEFPPTSSSINVENLQSLDTQLVKKNDVIIAYRDSDIYSAWKNGEFVTNDKNTNNVSTKISRIRGPFDYLPNHIGQSDPGRYIRIEAYKDISYEKQQDIIISNSSGTDYSTFLTGQTAIIYNAKPKLDLIDSKNLSFTCLFKLSEVVDSESFNFINGYDEETETGIKIDGSYSGGVLSVTTYINSISKTFLILNVDTDSWLALVISVSNEFKQFGGYVYLITEDATDIINHTKFRQIGSTISSLSISEFELDQYYVLQSSKLYLTNLRLFKTMIKEENHEFILSQLFIKDESLLLLIDNCRPQLNIPYIAKNR